MRTLCSAGIAALLMIVTTLPVTAGGVVALSFDDGPDPRLTPRLLDILRRENVVATFCLVGQRVAEHPEIARRMQAEGHELCNHSWNHPKLTRGNVDSQIAKTDAAIGAATGTVPRILRAPGGDIRNVGGCHGGRPFVGWGEHEDTLDWKYRNQSRIARVATEARPGTIILMHDIRPTTVASVPGIIAGLKARGMSFVRASSLWHHRCG
jgi:peptidoglycan/xylan/chitin deacetylase (PgdA/CDA1 family)